MNKSSALQKQISCSGFLAAQENMNKNSQESPMLGRVNCTETEFQVPMCFSGFFSVILKG